MLKASLACAGSFFLVQAAYAGNVPFFEADLPGFQNQSWLIKTRPDKLSDWGDVVVATVRSKGTTSGVYRDTTFTVYVVCDLDANEGYGYVAYPSTPGDKFGGFTDGPYIPSTPIKKGEEHGRGLWKAACAHTPWAR